MTITLNRPKSLNAINLDMGNMVASALSGAERDPDIRVIIVTGAGKIFSAGADLKAISRGELVYDPAGEWGDWGFAGCTEKTTTKPVIAAVNGLAYGGGFEIALAADLIVAARDARFALPEVKVGLLAGAGGAVRLSTHLPKKIAMDLLLTGDPITAEKAHHYGLVSRLADPGQAYEEAIKVALAISDNAPMAVQMTKKIALLLRDNQAAAEVEGWNMNKELFPRILASADKDEGATAFVEGRSPIWSGR